ncbi:hypothetical protein AB5J56_02915 [Streptomyces sp. R21]|uniref:Holin n=1 Tax=Streptomyces sp. R21 TaxID=3238627 RepID=A0AB39P0S9_9ACTN
MINLAEATDNAVNSGASRFRAVDAFPSPAEAGDTHARSGMEAAEWVTAALAGIAGVVSLLGYLFDQVPPLSRKAITAVRAVREEVKRK